MFTLLFKLFYTITMQSKNKFVYVHVSVTWPNKLLINVLCLHIYNYIYIRIRMFTVLVTAGFEGSLSCTAELKKQKTNKKQTDSDT